MRAKLPKITEEEMKELEKMPLEPTGENISVDCKVSPPLKMYMGFWRELGSAEGACLIFAHNSKEAKKLAFGVLSNWSSDTRWIDVGISLIKNSDYLYKEANQELLKNNIPHSIESPESCKRCKRWGYEINNEGICSNCREVEDNTKVMEGAATILGKYYNSNEVQEWLNTPLGARVSVPCYATETQQAKKVALVELKEKLNNLSE